MAGLAAADEARYLELPRWLQEVGHGETSATEP